MYTVLCVVSLPPFPGASQALNTPHMRSNEGKGVCVLCVCFAMSAEHPGLGTIDYAACTPLERVGVRISRREARRLIGT